MLMLEDIKARKIDCVVVKDFSRFGRNYITVSDYIDQIFPFMGVRFISVTDGYDSAKANGRTSGIDVAFKNIIMSFYSKDLSVKVKTAKRNKALQGKFIGGYPVFGYQKQKDNKHKLEVEELSAEVVKRVFEMALTGMTTGEIARVLNAEGIPTPMTYKNMIGLERKWHTVSDKVYWKDNDVYKILRNESYLGNVIYGKRYVVEVGSKQTKKSDPKDVISVPNMHNPLVALEDFEQAQKVIKEVAFKELSSPKVHLFSKKIRCGTCNHLLAKSANRYYCTTKNHVDDISCFKKHIKEEDMAEIVFQAIKTFITAYLKKKQVRGMKKATNTVAKIKKQLKIYHGSLKRCQMDKANLYDKKNEGIITAKEYLKLRTEKDTLEEEIRTHIEKLEQELSAISVSENTALPKDDTLMNYLQSEKLTREMVVYFVDCIYVYSQDEIHIDWNFDMSMTENTTS
ncbi:recombinase family protein [Chakrabartyella piscis]|uniref:recombinase family protein n=1 Tax=Chakrabartyella piscis TaxID=2918914 RepID=UPI002958D6BD|nr:recombinase family protein [Chakrabartyella piscis]